MHKHCPDSACIHTNMREAHIWARGTLNPQSGMLGCGAAVAVPCDMVTAGVIELLGPALALVVLALVVSADGRVGKRKSPNVAALGAVGASSAAAAAASARRFCCPLPMLVLLRGQINNKYGVCVQLYTAVHYKRLNLRQSSIGFLRHSGNRRLAVLGMGLRADAHSRCSRSAQYCAPALEGQFGVRHSPFACAIPCCSLASFIRIT